MLKTSKKRGRPLLWLLLLFHALLQTCRCSLSLSELRKGRPSRGIKELHRMLNQPSTGHGACDLDKICEWSWKNETFEVVNSETLAEQNGPMTDASNRRLGKFLWLTGNTTSQIWSKLIPRTGSKCYLELSVYQIENTHGKISLVVETINHVKNKTSVVVHERFGNNTARWETMKINLGDNRQEFRILLEIKLPYDNSSIGLDDIHLVDCFPEQRTFSHAECTEMMFRCRNNGSCLKRDHVCDFTLDCADGEDESEDCDKLPQEARCNFESDWCGWENLNELKWKLGRGPFSKQRMGPLADHTYRNSSGTYAYVEMSNGGSMGSEAVLKSPVFNPMPPYHSDPKNPYVNSCKVRFGYYQVDMNTLALGLWMVKLLPHQTRREKLFWSFKNTGGRWNSWAYALPNSRVKYYLLFEAVKGYGSNGLVAIDDFSLSPECFGIGVPASVVGDYNYYDQKSDVPPKHPDFTNASMILIDTCGQTGRLGPTPEQCAEAHNRTEVEVLSDSSLDVGDASLRSKGIQRWNVTHSGYYTIIATGARGGRGALATGISLGAMVKGIVELVKGQQLYFMVGQPGTDACQKKLGSKDDSCQKTKSNSTIDKIHEVKKTELSDGGGGGGGASYVFMLNENGEQLPLLIAGGGGGLGSTQFQDDQQDAKGILTGGTSRRPINGTSFKGNAGGGGGWLPSSPDETNDPHYGMALSKGGVGGLGCSPNHQGFGDGGFGGGGGGCLSGGGGGGYAGGDTGHEPSGNGAGGYSYAFPDLLYVADAEKQNSGPGEVYVIPGIPGCGCDFRCMAVDQYHSEVRCICPGGWHLGSNHKSCIKLGDGQDPTHKTIMIIMICLSVVLLMATSCLCLLLYNRYQARKIHSTKHRNAFILDNGTELRTVSNTMLSEFNPNYELAGNICSIQDFKNPIPRDQIKLIKALGQGAFGEVYQGVLRDPVKGDIDVAVKTLPVTSTAQANNDFIMEAVIMSKFDHPNIVQFIGVCFNEHPRYIILELLSGGDLKNFLREERPRSDLPTSLTMKDLLDMAQNVAMGCQYMQEQRFIHRDIAARNCLLTCKGPGRIVKVADFGMARDIYRNEYYKKGGSAMLPIKWMPPESFIDGMFTSKTDVWAYGVLLWEIMSFGYMPYTGCANNEVVTLVSHGGRLGKPAGCPDPVYGIMTSCWNSMASARPDFSEIVNRIMLCKQDPDVMNSPMPSFDILPLADREIMVPGRSDSENNEVIDIQAGLDKHGYMQPRVFYRPKTDQPNQLVYAALKLEEDRENCNETPETPDQQQPQQEKLDNCDNAEQCNNPKISSELNANVIESTDRKLDNSTTLESHNGNNGESSTTTDTTNSTTGTPPNATTPNKTKSSSSRGNNGNVVDSENYALNGMIRSTSGNNNNAKSTLKAALSLDPSALCNRVIPYEKIGFGPTSTMQQQRPSEHEGSSAGSSSKQGSAELSDRVGLPREECSC